jgi:NTP pyrophosphatase (non-canonical NTP hydrolase)
MTTSNSRKVQMWMESAGQLVTTDEDSKDLQMTFIEEEFYELLHAYNNLDRCDIIKEATDLIWVVYGLLHIMDVDVDEAFKRLFDSNNSKLPFTFKDGKVQKGKNYQPPTLTDL